MKQLSFLSIFLVFASTLLAQAPQNINYQGVARNAQGQPYANQNISVRLKIRNQLANGTVLYMETRNVTTNAFGLFTVVLNSSGTTSQTGNFPTIDWTTHAKFLETEIDPAGGSNFTSIGTTQMQSVPFALQSAKAADLEFPRADYFTNNSTTVWHLENTGTTPILHVKNSGSGGAVVTTAGNATAISATANTNTSTRGAVDASNTGTAGYAVRGTASNANTIGVEAINGTGLALNVNGRVKIAGGNTSPGAGKVLTSDANGNATWQNPTAPAVNKIGFSVRGSAGGGLENLPNGQRYKYHPGTELYDPGNDFAPIVQGIPSSSTFTVPVSGFYHFNAQIFLLPPQVLESINYAELRLVVNRNGTVTELATYDFPDNDAKKYDAILPLNVNVPLLAGDQVWLEINASCSGGNCKIWFSTKNFFSAYLIFAN